MDYCKRYFIMVMGCLIGACGFNAFLIPAHLLSGGLSGIAIIFHYLLDWPIGVQLIVFNLPVFYIAYRVFGRLYAVDTLIGTVLFSICIDATSFLSDYKLLDDMMLAAIFWRSIGWNRFWPGVSGQRQYRRLGCRRSCRQKVLFLRCRIRYLCA